MAYFNSKLEEILRGFLCGDPKYRKEYDNPMKIIQEAIDNGAELSQILKLSEMCLNENSLRYYGLDELDVRYALSQIPGYYGEFRNEREPNSELAKLLYSGRNPKKIIKSAMMDGLTEVQSEVLFDRLFDNDSSPYGEVDSVSEEFSEREEFPELMLKLSSVSGIKPSEIICRIWDHDTFSNQIETAELLADHYPEVVRYLEKETENLYKRAKEDAIYYGSVADNYASNLEALESRLAITKEIRDFEHMFENVEMIDSNKLIELAKNPDVKYSEKEKLLDILIACPTLYMANDLVRFAQEVEYANVNKIQDAILADGSIYAISNFMMGVNDRKFFGYSFKDNFPKLIDGLDKATDSIIEKNNYDLGNVARKKMLLNLLHRSLINLTNVYNYVDVPMGVGEKLEDYEQRSNELKGRLNGIITKLEEFYIKVEKLSTPASEDTPTA